MVSFARLTMARLEASSLTTENGVSIRRLRVPVFNRLLEMLTHVFHLSAIQLSANS
jgi:hypothetical protein